jgi:hypothetical protein
MEDHLSSAQHLYNPAWSPLRLQILSKDVRSRGWGREDESASSLGFDRSSFFAGAANLSRDVSPRLLGPSCIWSFCNYHLHTDKSNKEKELNSLIWMENPEQVKWALSGSLSHVFINSFIHSFKQAYTEHLPYAYHRAMSQGARNHRWISLTHAC